MKISTGLEPQIRHMKVPVHTRDVEFWRSDHTELLPIPTTREMDIWVIEFTSEDGHFIQSMASPVKPMIEKKGFTVQISRETPQTIRNEMIKRYREDYGAPSDARRYTRGDYFLNHTYHRELALVKYKVMWWEIEL